jgi:hypothetical protein
VTFDVTAQVSSTEDIHSFVSIANGGSDRDVEVAASGAVVIRDDKPALVALGTAFQVSALLGHVMTLATFSPQLTAAGHSVEDSILTALATSGRSVFFAGIIVCVALLGMSTLDVESLNGRAIAASV